MLYLESGTRSTNSPINFVYYASKLQRFTINTGVIACGSGSG